MRVRCDGGHPHCLRLPGDGYRLRRYPLDTGAGARVDDAIVTAARRRASIRAQRMSAHDDADLPFPG